MTIIIAFSFEIITLKSEWNGHSL